jgi:hypothetical protein
MQWQLKKPEDEKIVTDFCFETTEVKCFICGGDAIHRGGFLESSAINGEDKKILSKIRTAISCHHLELDERKNGNTSATKAVDKISSLLGMPWIQGQELQKVNKHPRLREIYERNEIVEQPKEEFSREIALAKQIELIKNSFKTCKCELVSVDSDEIFTNQIECIIGPRKYIITFEKLTTKIEDVMECISDAADADTQSSVWVKGVLQGCKRDDAGKLIPNA